MQEKTKKPFYESSWFLWLTLFFISPVGIFLVWRSSRFKKNTKIILTSIFSIWFLLVLIIGGNEENNKATMIAKPNVEITDIESAESSSNPTKNLQSVSDESKSTSQYPVETNAILSDNNVSPENSITESSDSKSTNPSSIIKQETMTQLPKEDASADKALEWQSNTKTIDEVCADLKSYISDYVSEFEVINSVSLISDSLHIDVDISKTPLGIFTIKEVAFDRTSFITDEILRHSEYDSLWNEIIVDFGETGYVSVAKTNVVTDEYGRFFKYGDFKLISPENASTTEVDETITQSSTDLINSSTDTSMGLSNETSQDYDRKPQGNIDNLTTEHESIVETTYIGNKNSKKFHEESCGKLPSPKNQVALNSRDEAIRRG